MPISEGVEAKKAKVYVDKDGGTYVQILPEIYCESEIKPDSLYPVSSSALSQWKATVETNTAPFAGATGTSNGASGTVPMAKPEDRNSFLRGDGKWTAIEITDNKVKNTASAYTRFYLAGSAQQATNTGMQYFDPNVYVSERAGELVAPKIIGNLTGNVTGDLYGNASYATADANGETIHTTYATKTEMAQRSLIGHQHSTADVVTLENYVRLNATGALAVTDTLNIALSKIESRLNESATMDSPALSGEPTTPTPTSTSGQKQIANKEYVDGAISNLIGGAGTALDTLGEIAAALNNNPNFAASMATELGKKLTTGTAGYVKALSISNATGGQNLTVQFGNDSTNVLFIKDTVVTAASAQPKADGTAAVGTSVKYAREDHVHPIQHDIPAGTRMVFQQTAAPTGWTKETGSGYNNTALRFVTGSVANKTNGKAFTSCMAAGRGTSSATQGGTISSQTIGGNVGATTLSVAQLAKHTHTVANVPNRWKHLVDGDDVGFQGIQSFATKTSSQTGSSSSHTHSLGSTSHNHTFTGSSHSHTLDIDINYIDCIIAKKN